MKVQVTVFPRQGVRDPQGEAVLDKIRRLDWLKTQVNHAAVGRIIVLDVDEDDPADATSVVVRMCQELLANEVVEDFEVVCLGD